MANGNTYALNAMDVNASFADTEYDQEEALLQGEGDDGRPAGAAPKRVYQNSDRTLLILGAIGSVVSTVLVFGLVYLLFGRTDGGHASSPLEAELVNVPLFGDIGCEFPGIEVISPSLEQNLTLLRDTLEIVTTGRAIGDMVFHTETEMEENDKQLEYVRIDVRLQGPRRADLHAVYTRVREGRYELQTPETPEGCMRYSLEVWLPRHLAALTVRTETLTHLTFADLAMDASIHDLTLKIGGDAVDNLLVLPEARIANAKYTLRQGFVVGTTLLYNTLVLDGGAAQTDVEVVLARDGRSTEEEVYHSMDFRTSTLGTYRVEVKNPEGYPFEAHHESTEATSMVLSYPASFVGQLSMSAGTLQTLGTGVDGGDVPRDGVVQLGSVEGPRSDIRVRNDLGSVWLTFQ